MEGEQTVYVLTKSFGRYSAGTQFRIRDITGGTIARCVTRYPIKLDATVVKPDYANADIPLKYLTPKRNRGEVKVA